MQTAILIMFGLFVLLQIVDAWSTVRGLQNGGREANPAIRWFMARIGILPALLLSKAAVIALIALALWRYGPHLWLAIALALACGFYAFFLIRYNSRSV